jgi:hypothetical protein
LRLIILSNAYCPLTIVSNGGFLVYK